MCRAGYTPVGQTWLQRSARSQRASPRSLPASASSAGSSVGCFRRWAFAAASAAGPMKPGCALSTGQADTQAPHSMQSSNLTSC